MCIVILIQSRSQQALLTFSVFRFFYCMKLFIIYQVAAIRAATAYIFLGLIYDNIESLLAPQCCFLSIYYCRVECGYYRSFLILIFDRRIYLKCSSNTQLSSFIIIKIIRIQQFVVDVVLTTASHITSVIRRQPTRIHRYDVVTLISPFRVSMVLVTVYRNQMAPLTTRS